MVFRKQLNEEGQYLDKEGNRWEILSCNHAEVQEMYETGEFSVSEDEDGNEIRTPIMAQRVVINKGWDAYDNEEAAAKAYGLVLQPKEGNHE